MLQVAVATNPCFYSMLNVPSERRRHNDDFDYDVIAGVLT